MDEVRRVIVKLGEDADFLNNIGVRRPELPREPVVLGTHSVSYVEDPLLSALDASIPPNAGFGQRRLGHADAGRFLQQSAQDSFFARCWCK
jgi:hypothetical protein